MVMEDILQDRPITSFHFKWAIYLDMLLWRKVYSKIDILVDTVQCGTSGRGLPFVDKNL